GVDADHIVDINFELMAFDHIREYRQFYKLLRDMIPKAGKCYLLLDEVQQVSNWEKAVNSLSVENDIDVDIYYSLPG
ncbi:MAG: AAA family ATPase, partial [Clostridiales bacterium]|nr:AAA family ATPase [Clostridiales bacterium]